MSQPKFRIVKRTGIHRHISYSNEVYVAQRKVLDLFWVDCDLIEADTPGITYDRDLRVVEEYIQEKLSRKQKPKEEVVKNYYDEDT